VYLDRGRELAESLKKDNHLRVVVVFGVECFCRCLFLASVQFFYSETTPIVFLKSACVNNIM